MEREIGEDDNHVLFNTDDESSVPFVDSTDHLNMVSKLEKLSQFAGMELQQILLRATLGSKQFEGKASCIWQNG